MLDDEIKMKRAVDFIVKFIIGNIFLSIFIGIFALFDLIKWT